METGQQADPVEKTRDIPGQELTETEALHETLRKSCVEMALNRIDGEEELYVGGIWALRRPSALKERNITHVLSVLRFDPGGLKSETDTWENYGKSYKHMVIDIDDVDDSDLLAHLPTAVRFIEDALHPKKGDNAKPETDDEETQNRNFREKARRLKEAVARDNEASTDESDTDLDAISPAPAPVPEFKNLDLGAERDADSPGAVFVHCAMGKSRSVSVIVAYLLWKYPARFGRSAASTAAAQKSSATAKLDDKAAVAIKEQATAAVAAAVKWVRKTREIAEPNPGFMNQLAMWWAMGCPADVESHPIYQRWSFQREIDESVAAGQAPSRLRFEDEEAPKGGPEKGTELRCKKCRRTLATPRFVLDHEREAKSKESCAHLFIEPLGWMRAELEKGTLEGRLSCPNVKCGAAVGRYSWKGFRCNCGGWVTPGFSLQRSRVDEVTVKAPGVAGMASLGIRMPPGTGRL